MNISERVTALRKLMKANGIDAYVVPDSDAHLSEYVADHWKSRRWISGFTGSAGTAVIIADDAGLWTDGRYYIQAERQLQGSGIRLFRSGQPGVPTYIEWLNDVLSEGSCVGLDGRVFSASIVKKMEHKFSSKRISIKSNLDFINDIWEDRPAVPANPVVHHDVCYAGKTTAEKLAEVRDKMKKKGASYHLLCSLDDIAWLYNIRGTDVKNNPVTISYALVSMEEAWLYIDNKKVSTKVHKKLETNGVELKAYDEIREQIANIKGDSVCLDPGKTNYWLYKAFNSSCRIVEGTNITTTLKAMKNEVEIENLKKCHLRDSVAMVRWLYWLDNTVGIKTVTEISASDKLEALRAEGDYYRGPSFDYIAGYKDHAAMMHYKATEDIQYTLEKGSMLLVDSGGQYLDGTTDITRTIVLGEISEEQRRDFTLVLKSNIALTCAKFLYGATGTNLDILARKPMWDAGLDYKCGTGHGVGFFLNVHEGPQGFSMKPSNVRLEKGMILTNEPGVYKEGRHGIRTENTMLVVEDEKTECGQFMKFETISFCPIDLEGIDPELLTVEEREWLNDYHQKTFELLSPHLNEDEREWLRHETRAI